MSNEAQATVRAFFALDLDAMSARRIFRASERLRMASGAPRATWTPLERVHVTLKFVEHLPVAAVEPLARVVGARVGETPLPAPFPFTLGAFPNVRRARIIVAELRDDAGALAALAKAVEALAHDHGLEREERAFRPHVTLARLKLPYDVRRWLKPVLADGSGECAAASVTLFRSDLGTDGPAYTPLARFAFAKG